MHAKQTLLIAFILLANSFTLVASKKPRVVQYIKELESWYTTCKTWLPECTILQSCAMILKQRKLPLEEYSSKIADEYPLEYYAEFLEQEWKAICSVYLVCKEHEACAFLLDKLDHIYAKENSKNILIHPNASQSILWPSLNHLKSAANELEKWHHICQEIEQQCTFLEASNLILTHQLKMIKTYNQINNLQIHCYKILRNIHTTLNTTIKKLTLSDTCAYCTSFPSQEISAYRSHICCQRFSPLTVLKEHFILSYLKHIGLSTLSLNENQENATPAYTYNNYGIDIAQKYKLYIHAISYFKKAIKMNPSYIDPWNNLAVCYSHLNDPDQAINALLESLKINPAYPEGYNNLAALYLTKKEYDKVKRYLNKALQLRPHYGKAYYNMGRMHAEQNNPYEALDCFKKACTIADLKNEFGFKTYAQYAFNQKKYIDAIWAYNKTLECAPHDTEIKFSLANTYHLSKQFGKSIELYKKLLVSCPHDDRIWYNLGHSYLEHENVKGALYCFKKIESQWKIFPQLRTYLKICSEKLSDS